MPENGPISLTRGNLAFDFPIWKIKAARWSAAQTRQGWQRVAERFFSALLRVPLRLCVKPGLAPREKDFPRAAGSVCSSDALCGGRPEMNNQTSLIQPEQIEQVILLIRGQRVIIAFDMPNWHFKPSRSGTT